MSPLNESWRAAWVTALDDLELTLEETEHLLQGGHPPASAGAAESWTPPAMPGPLPDDLLDRARELLARQQDLIVRTTQAATAVRTSTRMVDRIAEHGTPSRRTPVYVDVSA